MSETLDTNVLVYASTPSSPFHAIARQVVDTFARGPEIRHLFWPTVMGYLRIVTNSRIISPALAPDRACDNIADLIARSHIITVGEGEGFWSSFRRIGDDVGLRGDLVPDAHLVALMRQHGVRTIWTHDRDFRKFDGITVKNPFAS